MTAIIRNYLPQLLLGLMASATLADVALADDERRPRAPLLPKFQQECGTCHTAYPPGMLPAASWRRIMNNLPRHYGTDGSLDPATQKDLSVWINANAGAYRKVREEPPEDRITRSLWFVREHREISAATWKLPAVKTAANCSACHTQADRGSFNEREIRVPR